MAELPENGSTAGANSAQGQPPIQAQVVGQYIKDLSFENPNVGKLLDGAGESPNLKLEVNVNAKRAGRDLFESAIDFKAQATNKAGVIYDLELVYAGMFKIENMPSQALEPFLLINCPLLLFPFVRRLVADLTREGGFPPLLLDPIDFAGLFMRKKQQQETSTSLPRS
jgi:preprotein translocase subunit SecB